MKIKTSVTLSGAILKLIDAVIGESGNRSEFIERAIEHYIKQMTREQREREDLDILNRYCDRLNTESEDVLSYQVER